MTAVRTAAKHAVERLLVASGAAALARSRRRGEILILAYHNVVPHGDRVCGDQSLHLPQQRFARQLDVLARTHEVVSLADVLDAPPGGRPRAVITFDDAYRGAVTVGVEECTLRRLPATIFVPVGLLGQGSFWWDALADAPSGRLDPTVRAEALDVFAGRDREVRRWAEDHGREIRDVYPHQHVVSEAELAAAAAHPGITLGSHSWSHANLARLDAASLDEELRRPATWLRARFEAYIPWFAYPYGESSTVVEQAAASAGYVGALRVTGGWMRPTDTTGARHAIPRYNVPAGLSQAGFILRTAGLGLG